MGAVEALARRFPNRPGIPAAATLAIAVLTIASLPEFDRWVHDDIPTPMMARVAQLPGTVSSPAVVLFRYEPGADLHQEPVYNPDVAWPDDAADHPCPRSGAGAGPGFVSLLRAARSDTTGLPF